MPDQQQQQRERQQVDPAPWEPKSCSPFDGPRVPAIDKPDTSRLLKRMKVIDRDGAREYRKRKSQNWKKKAAKYPIDKARGSNAKYTEL